MKNGTSFGFRLFSIVFALCLSGAAAAGSDVGNPEKSGFKHCANEGGFCSFRGQGYVMYGTNSDAAQKKYGAVGAWTGGTKKIGEKLTMHGRGVKCDNKLHGDPAPGMAKKCYFKQA